MMNPAKSFLETAQAQQERAAIIGEGTEWTFGQLKQLIIAFALHLQRRGVQPGSTIAVRSDDLLVMLASQFAAALLGARWVAATRQMAARPQIDVTHWLQSYEIAETLHPDTIRIDPGWAHMPADFPPGAAPGFPGFENPADGWILARTSGTTGTAKYLEISAQAMQARFEAMGMDYIAGETRFACLFPVHAFPLIVRSCAALVNGACLVHSYNPIFWARSGVNLVMGSPAHVWRIFEGISLKDRIDTLHVGGAKTTDAQARELLANFSRVMDVYGSTEANQIYRTVKTLTDTGEVASKPEQMPRTELQVVGDDDNPLPPGHQGVVRVRSPYMVTGYLTAPEAEARAFRNGWFYPGDLGILSDSGQLEIVGRENDQINIGGAKLNALEIDDAIMRVEGISDAICFAIPRETNIPELVVFVTVDAAHSRDTCVKAAENACRDRFGAAWVPKKFLFMDKLPRNPNGKPDRTRCAMLALSARDRVV